MVDLPVSAESTVQSKPHDIGEDSPIQHIDLPRRYEALYATQQILEASKERYAELYAKYASLFDFAPIGYLVLDLEGIIKDANLTAAIMLDCARSALIGQPFTRFLHTDIQGSFNFKKFCSLQDHRPLKFDLTLVNGSRRILSVDVQSQLFVPQNAQQPEIRLTFTDISERLKLTKDLSLSHACLRIASEANQIHPLLNEFVAAIKSYLACDAVGIRLRDADGNIPYQAYDGFSAAFYERECPLALKAERCICNKAINGGFAPAELCITQRGSSYINTVSRLLIGSTFKVPIEEACRCCQACGYESVALVPIHIAKEFMGLIQVADRREDRLPLETVIELENSGLRLGLALERLYMQEQLAKTVRELRYLSSRLLRAQEDEQRRIAMELHDQTGQDINVLKLRLAGIRQRLPEDQPTLKASCDSILELIDKIIEDIRRLAHGLNPAMLETLGLRAALRELIHTFSKETRIEVRTSNLKALNQPWPLESQIVLYRILQEALTNIYKHARHARVWIRAWRKAKSVFLLIRDNGNGFDRDKMPKHALKPHSGMGLAAMALRARMIGADLQITSKPGRGVNIILEIPIHGEVPGR